MLGHINKTLGKQVAHFKTSLTRKEQYSPQEVNEMLSSMQSSLQESFKTILDSSDKKLSESKNELKKKNKMFNDLKLVSSKKQLKTANENDELRRELEKSQNKIRQLLKVSQKYEKVQEKPESRHTQDKGTQCELKDLKLEKILDDLEKQNILLTQKINELQQTIADNEQNIDSANVLIKELIMQLETNIADRETWSGLDSSRGSEVDSVSVNLQEKSEKSNESSDNEQEMSQQSADCGRETPGQDNSTIDGSNTTHRDFALPEWLEFNEPASIPKINQFDQMHEQDEEMWPQLIWNRIKESLGFE